VVTRQRRASARKHAARSHTCPLCKKVIKGNGGWSSHKRMHVRSWIEAGRKRLGFGPDAIKVLEYWEKKYELRP